MRGLGPVLLFCLSIPCLAHGVSPLKIDALHSIQRKCAFGAGVNGSRQWILIRGSDARNPVLLYLHGGPGHSLIPFAHVASSFLTDRFTVVYWDQRGAGLSCAAADPPETVNLKQLVADTLAVTEYLKKRFARCAIYLLGHSWGSELGILAVLQSPGSYSAYIGVGQVVSESSLQQARLIWLTTEMKDLLSSEDRERISTIRPGQPVPIAYVRKCGGSLHNISPTEQRTIMDSSPYRPDVYTGDLYDRGWYLSERMYEQEIVNLDFAKQAARIPIPAGAGGAFPLFFFLGRHDFVTPTGPVLDYFRVLEAPHKEMIWFEESGHRMDIEEPVKFQQTLIDKLLD